MHRDIEDDWFTSIEATALKVERAMKAYRVVLSFGLGALACFYGRHLTYSFFFWQDYAANGWPATQLALCELRRRFRAAVRAIRQEFPAGLPTAQQANEAAQQVLTRLQAVHAAYEAAQLDGDAASIEALNEEIQALQAELAPLRQAGSVVISASAELAPQSLYQIAMVLRCSFLGCLASATSHGAAKVGVGINIGDTVATAVNGAMAPRVQSLVDAGFVRSGDELCSLLEDPTAGKCVDYAIRMLCSSLGIAVAFFVEGLVFTVSNAYAGAELLTCEAVALLVHKGVLSRPSGALPMALLSQWLLCGAGLYFQFIHGAGGPVGVLRRLFCGAPGLTLPLRWALGTPLVLETWLQAGVVAMRAGILH